MKIFVNTAFVHLQGFDRNVYTRFRLFRTFLSTKLNEYRQFQHYSNTFSREINKLKQKDIFFLTLIAYPQRYFTTLKCSVFEDPRNHNVRHFCRNSTNVQICVNIPSVVSDFLDYFPGSYIFEKVPLVNTVRAPKIIFSLKNFPCPYCFPIVHSHKENNSYILYSSSYTQNYNFIFIRCHCDRKRERIPAAANYLKRTGPIN